MGTVGERACYFRVEWPMFPKEHGAWNGLIISLAAGWIALGRFNWAAITLSVLWLSAFALKGPWNYYRQYRQADPFKAGRARFLLLLLWMILLFSLFFTSRMVPRSAQSLLIQAGLPLGGVLLILVLWKRNLRFALAEILGFAGLTMAVPILYLCDDSHVLSTAFWLWGLFGGYFLLGLAGVKVRQKWLEGFRKGQWLSPGDRFSQGWWVILLYAVWVEGLGDATGGKLILMAAPLFAALKTLAVMIWGRTDTPMMRLGLWEMAYSILFTAIWAWTWVG